MFWLALAAFVLLFVAKVFSIMAISWFIVILPLLLWVAWLVLVFVVVFCMTMVVVILDQRGYRWRR